MLQLTAKRVECVELDVVQEFLFAGAVVIQAGQAHPGLKRTSGHIGFLGHGDEVHFRNIRVKPLAK